MENRNSTRGLVIGLFAWALAFVLALQLGAGGSADVEVIAQLRLPRALLASAVGIGLAVSGATLQALFANPLCEPYTLGISSGSALGAVMGTVLGFQFSFAGLMGSAFGGALVFAFVLYAITLRPGTTNLTLLLSGVMLGFLGSSLVALWMALADSNGVSGAIYWLMGDLSRARPEGALFSLGAALLLSTAIWSRRRELDALLMGEEGALALGIAVPTVRRRLIVLASLLVGLCVSGGGMIGFVGLLIPHFGRWLAGSMHARLLPVAAVWGAASLTAADALARVIVRPYELPVGVVTALVGVPLFLVMILRKPRSA